MSGAAVLAELTALGAGVDLGEGGRLRIDAPAGALSPELVRKVRIVRNELLSLLGAEWDQVKADALLADVLAHLGGVAAAAATSGSASLERTVATYRNLIRSYHEERSEHFWESARKLLARWQIGAGNDPER